MTIACGSDISGPPEEVTFAPGLGVDLTQMTRTSTGLYYQDITVGDGEEAVPGATLSVHYTGWLPDGTEFDSSRQPGRSPFQFVLGARQVISGWDEGLNGMRVGGERRLVIPPHLGYGQAGSGDIPGNTSLVFEVELLAVE
jgi:FKBP-type peptidyl-prolyl cis-trans isomerase